MQERAILCPADVKRHTLTSEIWFPRSPEEAFDLFSDIHRLREMAPEWVHFRLLTPDPIEMGLGTVIDYRVRLHGVPIRWRAKITAWDPPHRFVDEQIRGPYSLWIHEHLFEPRDGGVLCRDHVEYAHAGGWPVHRLLVRPSLDRIWAHRLQRSREFLNAPGGDQHP